MPRVTPSTKPPLRTEAEVQRSVLRAARQLGIPLDRQNVGAVKNPSGRLIRYGKAGNADLTGTIPRGPHAGKRLEVECKRGAWKPPKRGKAALHWGRQLARLKATCEAGAFAFWVSDVSDFIRAMEAILSTPSLRVEWLDDGDWRLTDQPERL